jgi:hypothetical protein
MIEKKDFNIFVELNLEVFHVIFFAFALFDVL